MAEGRTVERLADRFGRSAELQGAFGARRSEPAAGIRESERIIRLFKGCQREDFEAACRDLRLREGAEDAVRDLRDMGFRIGVVSASYLPAAEEVRERLGLDFAVAAEPEIEAGRLTGRLRSSAYNGDCGTFICKEKVLAAHRDGRDQFVVAVGDGWNDLCMFEAADMAVALAPAPLEVRLAADVAVRDLRGVPAVVRKHLALIPVVAPEVAAL